MKLRSRLKRENEVFILKRLLCYILLLVVLVSSQFAMIPVAAVANEYLPNDSDVIASAVLGESVQMNGCRVWQADENKPQIQNRGGRDGWFLDPAVGNSNRYICMDVDDSILSNLKDGTNLELVITYYDDSDGTIAVEYPAYQNNNTAVNANKWDAKTNASVVREERVDMHSTKMWKESILIMEKPTMRNELNSADFHIGIYTDKMGFLQYGTVLVSKIEVREAGTSSRFGMQVSSSHYGNIFFTGDAMDFTVTINNSVYPELAYADGEYETELIWSLYDRYGGIYRQKKSSAVIKPYEETKQTISFDDIDKYGVYIIKVEAINSTKKIYSSVYGRCSYVITTNGKIRNPHGGINVPLLGDKEEEVADYLYKAGFTHIASYAPISQWGRVAYPNNKTCASEISPTTGDLKIWNALAGKGFDVGTYVPRGTANSSTTNVLLDDAEPIANGLSPVTEKGAKNLAEQNLKVIEIMGDSLDRIFVSNEINIAPVLNEDRWAAAMARTQEYSYKAIKQRYPNFPVGGPQVLAIGNDNAWLENFLKAGGGNYMDFFASHPYLQKERPIAADMWHSTSERGGTLTELKNLLDEYNVDVPLYATEYGYSSRYYTTYTTLKQACWDIQQYMELMQEDLFDVAYVFQISDSRYGKAGVTKENGFGLLYGLMTRDDPLYDGTAKEAFLAYSNVNIQMADTKYVSRREFDENHTRCYQWKKQDTQEDMLTLFTDLDNTYHTFDLGTDKVTVVDMYGNEQEICGKSGVFTFVVTQEPIYIKGHFKNSVHLESGDLTPENAIYSAAPGQDVTIKIRNADNSKYSADVQTVSSSSIMVKKLANDSITLHINNDIVFDIEPINIKISNENGVVFDGIVMLTYINKIKMDNIVAKNKNGAWEIRTTLTNNDENVSFDGTLKIVGPSKWTDSIQPVDVKLEPGEEKTVVQTLIKNMEEFSGDVVSFGYITDETTLSGAYNSTELDFLYAAKADKEIKIDADLTEWSNAGWIKANRTDMFEAVVGYNNEYTGLSDISGEVAVMWDEENIYFAGKVYDDVQYCENTTADRMWEMDSIQLAYIYDPNGELPDSTFEEVAMGLLNGKPTLYRHKTSLSISDKDKIINVEGAEFAAKREGTETYYELKMPWKSVIKDPSKIEAGIVFKMAVLINENDGNGRKGYYKIGDGIAGSKNSKTFLKLYFQD